MNITKYTDEKQLAEINAEIEKELISALEAKERGEEYYFDEDKKDIEKGTKHFIFLFIMTILLVAVVFLKFGVIIINLFV